MNQYKFQDLINEDPKFKKLEAKYHLSVKYHATTHRLKLSLEYLNTAIERLRINDIFIYKTCLEMSIITYAACFNNSKSLLKDNYIPVNNILKDDLELIKLHEKIKYYRDKIIAHQDKVKELDYDIYIIQEDDSIEFEFPFLLKLEITNAERDNFKKIIVEIHDYLDLKRQTHDEQLKKDVKTILLFNKS